jgi:hypothetical protein
MTLRTLAGRALVAIVSLAPYRTTPPAVAAKVAAMVK